MGSVENYKKSIIKTIAWTMLSLFLALGVCIILMVFVFSGTFGDFMYDIGCDRWASSLYYRQYNKDNNIIYCYKALNIRISLGDSEQIIEYYDAFVNNDDYVEFLTASRENVEKLNIGVLEKSSMLHEDNYLTNNYVKALIDVGKIDEAWDIALEEFVKVDNVQVENIGVYAFSNFIDDECSCFVKIYDNLENPLIVEMQEYFDNAYALLGGSTPVGSLDRAYLVALGNRIISVGQDINKIYSVLNASGENVTANVQKMINVNNIIKGLI